MATQEALQAIRSCANIRDLGGFHTPHGTTLHRRAVRCGGTRALMEQDLEAFRAYGISRVLDLRGAGESPRLTCRFARQPWVRWLNVPLYDRDISAPSLLPCDGTGNYLVSSYLNMLSAPHELQRIMAFFAKARPDECVLFHCAAGMDRTGMVALLLLGLVDVSREDVVFDYALSFGSAEQVRAAMGPGAPHDAVVGEEVFTHSLLGMRIEAVSHVYDTVVQTHGSIRSFLGAAGISQGVLDAVRAHLLGCEGG